MKEVQKTDGQNVVIGIEPLVNQLLRQPGPPAVSTINFPELVFINIYWGLWRTVEKIGRPTVGIGVKSLVSQLVGHPFFHEMSIVSHLQVPCTCGSGIMIHQATSTSRKPSFILPPKPQASASPSPVSPIPIPNRKPPHTPPHNPLSPPPDH